MFPLSRGKIALLVVPIALCGLFYAWTGLRSRPLEGAEADKVDKPHPLEGVNGPAGISSLPLAIAYSPSGQLYCSSRDGNVQVYIPEKKRFRSLLLAPPPPGEGGSFRSGGYSLRLFFSRDGKRMFVPIASSYGGASTQVVDMEGHRATGLWEGSHSGAIDFSADEKWMALGENNGVLLVDLTQVKPLPVGAPNTPAHKTNSAAYSFFNTGSRVASLDFSPDSKSLAIGYHGNIALFNVASGLKKPRAVCDLAGMSLSTPPVFTPAQPELVADNPFWIEWAPDGTRFATYSIDEIALFSPTLDKLASAPLGRPANRSTNIDNGPGRGFSVMEQNMFGGANLVWDRQGKTLLSGGDAVRRWDGATLELQKTYEVPGPVALSPDEKKIATFSNLTPGEYPHLQEWELQPS